MRDIQDRLQKEMRFVAELKKVVGSANVFVGDSIDERYRRDNINKFHGAPGYVVRPASSKQVAELLKIAARYDLPVTPLGGRTGTVGGGISEDGAIVLSLERMNKILEIDSASRTMTVEAGATLQAVQEAAEAQAMMLPLDLPARGSCTIGGNIATNAGGLRVLRWGMMRDMVIGLEAVLADGTIVSSLTKALKDNAGYNWKQLLIGSEGTLGIITKAVLRLRSQPSTAQTAIVAMNRFDDAVQLLRLLDGELSGQLSSFELMWQNFYEFSSDFHAAKRGRPLPASYPIYAIVESLGNHKEQDQAAFEEALAIAIEDGTAADIVIAQSERERANIWAVRDDISDMLRPLWPLQSYDVSMPLSAMPEFVRKSEAAIREHFPDAIIHHYGHAGDGNLHVIVSTGAADPESTLMVDNAVYRALPETGGSIAAEHGVGRERKPFIGLSRSPEELGLMLTIKRALDPKNILNPNVIISAA